MMDIARYIDLVTGVEFREKAIAMTGEEIAESLGSEMAQMWGYDQKSPFHEDDLWTHSVRVTASISPVGLEYDDYVMLRLSGMFHDIGKPAVAAWDEEAGYMKYPGHAKASAKIAEDVLHSMGLDEGMLKRVLFQIIHHDDLMNYRTRQQLSFKPEEGKTAIDSQSVARWIVANETADGYETGIKEYNLLALFITSDILAQAPFSEVRGKVISTQRERIDIVNEVKNCMRVAWFQRSSVR